MRYKKASILRVYITCLKNVTEQNETKHNQTSITRVYRYTSLSWIVTLSLLFYRKVLFKAHTCKQIRR